MAETETRAPDSDTSNKINKDVEWFIPNVQGIGQPARELLENYSKIPPERVIPHVLEIVSAPLPLLSIPSLPKRTKTLHP